MVTSGQGGGGDSAANGEPSYLPLSRHSHIYFTQIRTMCANVSSTCSSLLLLWVPAQECGKKTLQQLFPIRIRDSTKSITLGLPNNLNVCIDDDHKLLQSSFIPTSVAIMHFFNSYWSWNAFGFTFSKLEVEIGRLGRLACRNRRTSFYPLNLSQNTTYYTHMVKLSFEIVLTCKKSLDNPIALSCSSV